MLHRPINYYHYILKEEDTVTYILAWCGIYTTHDDVIKWKRFRRYWPFVRGIHRSPVNSPHKGQWRGALVFSLICARINGWVNNHEAGDLRRHPTHCDVIIMQTAHYWARFLSLSQTCLRTVLDGNNLLSFLAETIWFSVAVFATRS